MSHPWRRLGTPFLLLLALGACDSPELSWVVTFEDSAVRDQTVLVSLEVREGSCATMGSVVYTATVRPGEMNPESLSLPDGIYAFSARARDAGCFDVASVCNEVTIPVSDPSVEVVLRAMDPVDACAATETCVDGICSSEMEDGGMPDGCVPSLEECNGEDDDCDSMTDEDFDLETDVMHCGACGMACTVPSGTPECRAGVCGVACPPGTGDCNGDSSDGCEVDTTTSVTHCGACDRACGTGVACMEGSCEDEIVRVAAGDGFTCAATQAGTVACWGKNDSDQLTAAADAPPGVPVVIAGVTSGSLVAAGSRHACATQASGEVRCWGWGRSGQLGDGTGENRGAPVNVRSISDAQSIAAGASSTCAVLPDGAAECWGANGQGQLGDGTTMDRTSPVRVAVLTNATQVSAGEAHACALQRSGSVRCWGDNELGQIGDGNGGTDATSSREVMGISTAASIAAGGDHACASLEDGTVQCWGRGASGELGDGSTRGSDVAVVTANLIDAAGVAAGGMHSCALRAGGTIACWGENTVGQLGDGTNDRHVRATAVLNVDDATLVVGGRQHTCALDGSGGLLCWGDNMHGELGIGHTLLSSANTPREVAGLRGAVELASGADHVCVRRLSGQVLCWGENASGQIGDGSTTARNTPVEISGISARHLAIGDAHSCAIVDDGTLSCWGENGDGQLGLGTTDDANAPTAVGGPSGVTAAGAGAAHTCAVHTGGVSCWGANAAGQVGDGTTIMRSAPVAVSGLSSTVALALGGRHSCALSASGAVSCWGDNASGQLGLGDIPNQPTPTSVSGLSSVAQLGAGTDFTCALATDGRVRCFGDNARGQIGTGSTGAGVNTPTLVSGLDDAVSLSLGDAHVCAARAGGAVSCWGAGGGGQLGDGDVMDRSAPGDTDPLIDQAVSVAVGADHSCARLGRGAILCWGLNRSGQVGDGSTMPRPNPTLTVGLP